MAVWNMRNSMNYLKLLFIPCAENRYRPRILAGEFLFYYFLFLVSLKVILLFYLIYLPKSALFADISSSTLLELANRDRQEQGLSALTENLKLDEAAKLKAEDIFLKGYFEHYSPEGKSPWYWFDKANYKYAYAGENLAIGFTESKDNYQAWKDSPSHKANLFSENYQETGIAILQGNYQGKEVYVVVQMFGSPAVKRGLASAELKQNATGAGSAAESAKPVATSSLPGQDGLIGKTEEGSLEASAPKAEVLSAETKEPPKSSEFNILSFFSLRYNNLVNNLTYFSFLFVVLASVLNIFIKFDIQYRDLVLKAAFFAAALVVFRLVDETVILRIISNIFKIY